MPGYGTSFVGPQNEAQRDSLGISWNTASAQAKAGLPPPPERANFGTDEEYQEAQSGWGHYVAPLMVRRQQILEGQNSQEGMKKPQQRQP